jgi:hypothetical protein
MPLLLPLGSGGTAGPVYIRLNGVYVRYDNKMAIDKHLCDCKCREKEEGACPTTEWVAANCETWYRITISGLTGVLAVFNNTYADRLYGMGSSGWLTSPVIEESGYYCDISIQCREDPGGVWQMRIQVTDGFVTVAELYATKVATSASCPDGDYTGDFSATVF